MQKIAISHKIYLTRYFLVKKIKIKLMPNFFMVPPPSLNQFQESTPSGFRWNIEHLGVLQPVEFDENVEHQIENSPYALMLKTCFLEILKQRLELKRH